MKQARLIYIFALSLLPINLNAQDTLRINFGPEYQKDYGNGSMLLIDNNENQIRLDGETYQMTYPDNFVVKDTAIALNYFTGWRNAAIKNNAAFLIGNYKSKSPIVYVDYNHNLDFSDDGQPLCFSSDSTLTVYLYHSENTSAFFPIQFSCPKMTSEEKIKTEKFFKSMSPYDDVNSIVPIDYWFADCRMNYKFAQTWLNGNLINIALHDWDCNGLYNNSGPDADQIMIAVEGDLNEDNITVGSSTQTTILYKLSKNAFDYNKNVQIPIGKEVYEVIDIEPTGRYIDLVESKRAFQKPLDTGDLIGHIEINLITGETYTLERLKKENKYTIFGVHGAKVASHPFQI